MVEPGQILAGKFQVERVLGQGGMGVVVAAQHLQLGQLVALKFLLPEAMRNPETAERFLREARATVRLKSDHVGRVIDVGTLENGAPYIVMEYLAGEDLHQFRTRHIRLPVAQAVDFVLQASEAIAEAHSIGIIHRDLKPANLFLTVSADGMPWVKVLDFGISKATGQTEDFSLTKTATIMGSPGYMSPEQLRSARDVDARTDVWALGVILYELVNGKAPFAGETITELTIKVVMDPTPPLEVAVPAGFEAILARCLAKEASDRFGSVAELAAALVPYGPPSAHELASRIARVQAGLATSIRKSGIAAAMVSTTLGGSSGQASSPAQTGAPAPKRKLGIALAAGGAVIAAIVAAVILAGGGGKSAAAPGGESGNGSSAASGAQPSTGSVTGSAAGTGSGSVTGSDPGSGSGSVTGSDPGTGSGSGSVTGTGSGSVTGTGAGSVTGSDPGTGPGSAEATGAGSGSSAAAGAGSGSATASGSDPGSGSGSGSGRRRGSGRGSSRGSGSGSGSGEDFSNSRF